MLSHGEPQEDFTLRERYLLLNYKEITTIMCGFQVLNTGKHLQINGVRPPINIIGPKIQIGVFVIGSEPGRVVVDHS